MRVTRDVSSMTRPTHTFVCSECRRSFEVDDGMREALLTSGCALCGAPVVATDLSAGSTAAE
jgi:predicted nucleic acid-binding Zn ribbon protein